MHHLLYSSSPNDSGVGIFPIVRARLEHCTNLIQLKELKSCSFRVPDKVSPGTDFVFENDGGLNLGDEQSSTMPANFEPK